MDWEDKFRRLRKDSNEGKPSFLNTIIKNQSITLEAKVEVQKRSQAVNETAVKRSVKTEKETVLGSLRELTQDKLEETGSGIKFPGGEISVVDNKKETAVEEISIDANINPKELDVLFVYRYSSDALSMDEENRLEAPSEQLLKRMIKAMKMDEDKYELLTIEEGEKEIFHKKLAEVKAKIIVPMGAIATNLILGQQERISQVHGKFFTRQLSYQNSQIRSFQVVPVFNPEMILINPNMKRSTWLDLQKIMEKLEMSSD